MKNILNKELKLALHPTSIIFLSFAAMFLIPNYCYYAIFFYTTLGIFFINLSGRENNDIFYTMLLPVCKKDIVKGRFILINIIEVLEILLSIPFIILRNNILSAGNLAGMDANIAILGFAFILYGIFNLIFLTKYYKNVDKIGSSFVHGSIGVGLFVTIMEAGVHISSFMKNYLDCSIYEHTALQLIVLVIGVAIYILFNLIAYKKSVESFEKLDL